MSDILNKVILFAVGAAVGSVVTWKLVKTKYEQIAQEEIDSVKEVFSRRSSNNDESTDAVSKEDKSAYADLIDQEKYISESEGDNMDRPYVIIPEEFGDVEGYDTISLSYYSDGVLVDDLDEVVDNVDELVGIDSLTHFGEYEDDSVYVRNDRLKTDYEILMIYKDYYDIPDGGPRNMEE